MLAVEDVLGGGVWWRATVELRDRCVFGLFGLSGVGRTTVVLAIAVAIVAVADGGGGREKLFKGVETSSCWLLSWADGEKE